MSGWYKDKDGDFHVYPDGPEIIVDPKTKKPFIWNNNMELGIVDLPFDTVARCACCSPLGGKPLYEHNDCVVQLIGNKLCLDDIVEGFRYLIEVEICACPICGRPL